MMNTVLYEHRQYPMFRTRALILVPMGIFGFIACWNFLAGVRIDEGFGLLIPAVLLLLIDCLFHSLNVGVTQDYIELSYGPGLIRTRFEIAQIESTTIVRNKWWYGLGIRKIRNGWLYNISGLDAIELSMKNGRRYRIGTDQPESLHAAVSTALGQS